MDASELREIEVQLEQDACAEIRASIAKYATLLQEKVAAEKEIADKEPVKDTELYEAFDEMIEKVADVQRSIGIAITKSAVVDIP